MTDRLNDPELCTHQREALRSPFPLGWFYFMARRCFECEREAHETWVEHVRERLLAGLEAAREGRQFEWESSLQVVASTQIGTWELVRVSHDD